MTVYELCVCTLTQLKLYTHITQIRGSSVYEDRIALCDCERGLCERWGAGVETQKNVRGEIGGWGRVPFNETYAPSLSTIYDGA